MHCRRTGYYCDVHWYEYKCAHTKHFVSEVRGLSQYLATRLCEISANHATFQEVIWQTEKKGLRRSHRWERMREKTERKSETCGQAWYISPALIHGAKDLNHSIRLTGIWLMRDNHVRCCRTMYSTIPIQPYSDVIYCSINLLSPVAFNARH